MVSDSATGVLESVNAALLRQLLDGGFTPVLTVPAITQSGELINVDNDRAAAVTATDLHAPTIVMLFEAPGLLIDPQDEQSLVHEVRGVQLNTSMQMVKGRMKKKLLGVVEAFSFGVEKVYFGDGRISRPVSSALAGNGTILRS